MWRESLFSHFFGFWGAVTPLCLPVFFTSRAVLKSGDIQVSEGVGLESPPRLGGGAGVFLALSVILLMSFFLEFNGLLITVESLK